jgi:hypothetical protein
MVALSGAVLVPCPEYGTLVRRSKAGIVVHHELSFVHELVGRYQYTAVQTESRNTEEVLRPRPKEAF